MTATALVGYYVGVFESSRSVIISRLWGKECGPFFQFSSFAFGAGALLSNFIVAPYLLPHSELNANMTLLSLERSGNEHNQVSRLQHPFTFVGVLMLVNIIALLATRRFTDRVTDHPSRGGSVVRASDQAVGNGDQKQNNWYKNVVLILEAVSLHADAGTQVVMGQFLVTYCVRSNIYLTKAAGVQIQQMFWSMMLVSNVTSLVYLPLLGNGKAILIGCVLTISGSLLINSMPNIESVLWAGVTVIGFGEAIYYGSIMAYLESAIGMDSTLAGVASVAYITGEITFPAFISFLISDYLFLLIWIVTTCGSILLLSFFFIKIICDQKILGSKQYESMY